MHRASGPVQNERMVVLRIRDVPETLRDALAKEAKGRHMSLQAYLLELLETRFDRPPFAEFAGRDDGVRTLPGELAADVAAERAEREEWLGSR